MTPHCRWPRYNALVHEAMATDGWAWRAYYACCVGHSWWATQLYTANVDRTKPRAAIMSTLPCLVCGQPVGTRT